MPTVAPLNRDPETEHERDICHRFDSDNTAGRLSHICACIFASFIGEGRLFDTMNVAVSIHVSARQVFSGSHLVSPEWVYRVLFLLLIRGNKRNAKPIFHSIFASANHTSNMLTCSNERLFLQFPVSGHACIFFALFPPSIHLLLFVSRQK
jgi:hypothetical protein